MPARTDHDRRDAQDAARSEIRVSVNRYIRRVYEESLAHLEEKVAVHDGISPVDWVHEGRVAAHKALANWGIDVPVTAIVGSVKDILDAIEAPADTSGSPQDP